MRPFSLGVGCSLGVVESLQGQRLRQAWHLVSAGPVREHPATGPPSRTATPSFQPGLSVSPDGDSVLGRLLEGRVAAGAPCSQAIPSPQPPEPGQLAPPLQTLPQAPLLVLEMLATLAAPWLADTSQPSLPRLSQCVPSVCCVFSGQSLLCVSACISYPVL